MVEGEVSWALQHCVAAADFDGGIANELAFKAWQFRSLNLTVNLARAPSGPWTLLKSSWLIADGGHSCCVTELSDIHGGSRATVQTVLLEARARQ